MKLNFKKEKNGITLIALVVTIIVLLILAGISISMLAGQNGILTRAAEAKENNDKAQTDETLKMAVMEALTEGQGVIKETNLKNALDKNLGANKYSINSAEEGWTINGLPSGKSYTVSSNGKISGDENNNNENETNAKYFTYVLDKTNKTAKITGIKDEYAVKGYYKNNYNGDTFDRDRSYNCGIKDGEKVIKDVIIPSKIEGCTVTEIGENAFGIRFYFEGYNDFANWFYLETDGMFNSFQLPDTITMIGKGAFKGCEKLESINMQSGLKSIGEYAFSGCKGLTSINIPNSVTSIGDYAFWYCTKSTSINIPNGVTSIGSYAFEGCTGLTSINIPDGVTSIGSYAFAYCKGLTSINIPNSVTSIGNLAFYECTGLTSINIPNSVTSIGKSAFYECTGLTSINIPNSVTSIGESAFSGCTGLTSINIPNSVTSIGIYAFSSCKNLTIILSSDSKLTIPSDKWGAKEVIKQ